jgi:hypothetical protein
LRKDKKRVDIEVWQGGPFRMPARRAGRGMGIATTLIWILDFKLSP